MTAVCSNDWSRPAIRPAIEGVDSVNEALVFNGIREPWRMYDPAMDVQIYPLTAVTCQIGETAVEERN